MPNSSPVSSPVLVNVDENGVTSIRVIFQDSDLSDTHTLTLNTDEMTGSGTVVSDDTFHYDPGTAFDYLRVGETATDTFSYTVTDAAGESSTSTVTITVVGHNDGPIAVAVAAETDENTSIVILPDFVDPDNNDTHSFTVDTSGTVGSVTVNPDGTFSYDPNGKFDHLGAGETATDIFTYTVTDAAGESSTETVTVTINGLSSNTSPDTFPYEFITDEDTQIVFRTIFHDPDVGDTHTYSLNTDGLIGTLTETGEGVFHYDPSIGFDYLAAGETATTTFTYTVTDSSGASDTDTVTITVTGRNDAPVASAMNVSTSESKPLVIAPDFTDPDTSDTHTFTVDTSSTAGTVTVNDDGTFTYNPNGQFNDLDTGESGTDSFTYTVTDASGASSTETITVTVNGEGDFLINPTKLIASDGGAEDYFGRHAQVNGQGIVVVGSYGDDDNGRNSGAVYVYTPTESGVFSEAKITASDAGTQVGFGENVSVNDSGVIVVGSSEKSSDGNTYGRLYVYTPTEDGEYIETKIPVSSRYVLGAHGLTINESGVIAAANYYGNTDVIYIFTPDGAGGFSEAKLTSLNGFGGKMHLNDNGVIYANGPYGMARVFSPDGSGGYTETQFNVASSDSSGSYGGNVGVVSNDGTVMFVASSASDFFIYEPIEDGQFEVSLVKTGAAISAIDTNNRGDIAVSHPGGVALVFVQDETGQYKQIKLGAFDQNTGDPYNAFGNDISINENGDVIVSASYDDDNGTKSGAVYVFTLNEDGNYVGPDGTVYEPSDTPPVIETLDNTSLTINGSEHAEVLKGGLDADTINGNDGNDVISGGAGDDQLSGGSGNDIFKFAASESGHDVITDFEAGAGSPDVIEFENTIFSDFEAVFAATEQVGANTVITLDDDTSITLKGVTLSDLHQDDFSFV